jgi:hypothetical protein
MVEEDVGNLPVGRGDSLRLKGLDGRVHHDRGRHRADTDFVRDAGLERHAAHDAKGRQAGGLYGRKRGD